MKQPIKKYFFLFALFSFVSKGFSGNGKPSEPQNTIRFTENKNQWDKQVLYRAQLDGGALFLEKNCFTYNFYDKETVRQSHSGNKVDSEKATKIATHAFRMTFLAAEESVITTAKQMTSDYCNFFIGSDKSKWVGNAKNYKEVNYKNLYKGIDFQILGYQNSIKYNFLVAKGANTNDVQLYYEGLDQISLENGTLKLRTSINEIVEQRPFAYQWIEGSRVAVPCEFVLDKTTISFKFSRGYNKGYELIIDPVLIFAATSGSIADNFGMTATYDSEGNLYSGGTAFGVGYPVTLGVYDPTWNGSNVYIDGRTDVVITKYDSSGTFLRYSTYFGGWQGSEIVTSLVVDAQNELFLYGATGSNDFPTTASAYDKTFNGGINLHFICNGTFFDDGTDIYVAKFNATGTSLLASTYIGGRMNDGVNHNNDSLSTNQCSTFSVWEFLKDSLQYNYGDQYRGEINVDKYGNPCIVSSTRSGDFPIVNGFDNKIGGKQDAVVFKFNSDLSQLLWSTFLGGSDNDAGYALALDDSANVYVTGGTRSADFNTTAGAYNTSFNGGKADGYITKIDKTGSSIIFSTFLGTGAYDQCYFVQLDRKGDVYVVGQTEGAMPITTGVYNNPNSGQFITKMNDSLNTMIFSTVFGNGNGSPNISPSAFLVDNCANIYVSGWGGDILPGGLATNGMPLTTNAVQSSTDGFNFYLIVLSTDAASLLYATYFGGGISKEHVDGGTSRFDKKGIVYQSVCANCGGYNVFTQHDDFPVSPGAWPNTGSNVNHNTQNYNCNNGVFKFDFQVPLADANFTVDHFNGCAPLTIQFDNQSSTGGKYLWDFGNNDTTSAVLNPIRTYTTPGVYLVILLVNDPASCNIWDTAYQYVTVYPPVTADFDFITAPCNNQVVFSDSSKVTPVSWLWNFDDGDTSTVQNPTHIYNAAGIYDVTLITSTINGCKDTTVVQIDFPSDTATIKSDQNICFGKSVQLKATGGFAYNWSPATSLSNSTIPNPIATPTITTTYTVNISTINSKGDTCLKTLTTTVFVFNPTSYTLTASVDKDTLFEGESTHIHAITDTTLKIIWTPATGLNDPTSFNPTVKPDKTTTYIVTIVDSSGCPRTASITIYVISPSCKAEDVFVPNTFTPNGDGHNDILYVRSNSLTNLYFAVYNRWGQLVFETTDINIGWDGIYKGMKADPAVFAWYLRGECYNKEKFKTQGNVTLIR